MKFTKEQAIEALKAKIPAKDKELDLARTITEAVDNSLEFVGEDSEMELTDFVEKVWKQVKTSIGLTHSENSKVAQKLKDQIAELQRKLDGKGDDDDNDDDDDDKVTSKDPAIKALMDKLTKMEEKLNAQDSERAISDKRSQLKAKMAESIKDNDWIDSYLEEITITEDFDVDAKATKYVEFYNKSHAGGGKTTPRKTGGDDDASEKQIKNVVSAAAALKKTMSANHGGGPVVSEKVEQ